MSPPAKHAFFAICLLIVALISYQVSLMKKGLLPMDKAGILIGSWAAYACFGVLSLCAMAGFEVSGLGLDREFLPWGLPVAGAFALIEHFNVRRRIVRGEFLPPPPTGPPAQVGPAKLLLGFVMFAFGFNTLSAGLMPRLAEGWTHDLKKVLLASLAATVVFYVWGRAQRPRG